MSSPSEFSKLRQIPNSDKKEFRLYTLDVSTEADLDVEILKGPDGAIWIDELDFTVGSNGKTELLTVRELLCQLAQKFVHNLRERSMNDMLEDEIDTIGVKVAILVQMMDLSAPFTVRLIDTTGYSRFSISNKVMAMLLD